MLFTCVFCSFLDTDDGFAFVSAVFFIPPFFSVNPTFLLFSLFILLWCILMWMCSQVPRSSRGAIYPSMQFEKVPFFRVCASL